MSQFSHWGHYSFASLDAPRDAYLHDLFDDGLVRADLGALQSADALADPGDEGELSTLAHGVSHCDSDKAKETSVILGGDKRQCVSPFKGQADVKWEID